MALHIIAIRAPSNVQGNKPAQQRLAGSAKEFESILLNQWLQGAEASFGAAPDGEAGGDAGGEQMKSFATQQLAGHMAVSGGLGIGRLVERALQHTAHKPTGLPQDPASTVAPSSVQTLRNPSRSAAALSRFPKELAP